MVAAGAQVQQEVGGVHPAERVGDGGHLEAAGNELGLICHELAVQAVDHTHLQQPFPVLNTTAKAQISECAVSHCIYIILYSNNYCGPQEPAGFLEVVRVVGSFQG